MVLCIWLLREYLRVDHDCVEEFRVDHDGLVDASQPGLVPDFFEDILIFFRQTKEIFPPPVVRRDLLIQRSSESSVDSFQFYRMRSVVSEGCNDRGEVGLLFLDFLVCERHVVQRWLSSPGLLLAVRHTGRIELL